MNKTIVATKDRSNRDLYRNENFFLMKTYSLDTVINSIENLIKEHINGNTYKNSRKFIIEKFSKKILSIYNKILINA